MRQLAASGLMALLLLAAAPHLAADTALSGAQVVIHADVTANMPAADAEATESSPLVWLVPLFMGVFALVLVFVIRRYSRPERQPKAQEDIQKPGN